MLLFGVVAVFVDDIVRAVVDVDAVRAVHIGLVGVVVCSFCCCINWCCCLLFIVVANFVAVTDVVHVGLVGVIVCSFLLLY